MTTRKDAIRSVAAALGTKQDTIPWQTAMLGDGHGTVISPTDRNMCYARLMSNSSVIEVLNLRVSPIDGLLVRISKTPEMPLVWQVMSQADQRVDENGGGSGVGVNYNLPLHAALHSYLSVDQVNIDWRQITNLRVYVQSAFTVGVLPGLLPRSGADLVVPLQTIDLTAHVPVSGAIYALISVNSSGSLVVTDGANVADLTALALTDIPDTPAGNFRIAAVRLYAGQAALSESTSNNDIRDLRWPQEDNPPRGSMYADDIAQAVTVSAANTEYKVTGGLTGGLCYGFTFQNASELLCAVPATYEVVWGMSISSGTNNENLSGGVVINTVTWRHDSEGSSNQNNSNNPIHVGGSCHVALIANDTVGIYVENESAAHNITVRHANLTIKRIGA